MNGPYGDVTDIRLPEMTVSVVAGDVNPNCICLDERHPQCPQHPGQDTARGEVA